MANSRAEVNLEFRGTPWQALGWILLSIVGGVLCIPLAWVNAAIARWLCRTTIFSDGTSAEFRGTGGEIVVWMVLLFLITVGQQLAMARTDPGDYGSMIAIFGISYIVMIAIAHTLVKWFVYNLRLSSGPHLTFTGSFVGLLGWYVLLIVSGVTIIGWAWVAVAMYQWIARNTKGDGIAIEFRASGFEFLWRALAAALGSIFIVTIPFLTIWFTRWLIANIVLIRGVETEWGGFIEEQRTPQKPSWPAVPPLHRH
ncbi:MAG: hypothetical protein ABIR70_16410 [Bryobacteraceae bacterium]